MLPATEWLALRFHQGDQATIDGIAEQLARSTGCVSAAARAIGVSRRTLIRWIEARPELTAALVAARKAQR